MINNMPISNNKYSTNIKCISGTKASWIIDIIMNNKYLPNVNYINVILLPLLPFISKRCIDELILDDGYIEVTINALWVIDMLNDNKCIWVNDRFIFVQLILIDYVNNQKILDYRYNCHRFACLFSHRYLSIILWKKSDYNIPHSVTLESAHMSYNSYSWQLLWSIGTPAVCFV